MKLLFTILSVAIIAGCTSGPIQNYPIEVSVQRDLARYGFEDVDVEGLTRSQITELHFKFDTAPARFSGRAPIFRQEIRAILRRKPFNS